MAEPPRPETWSGQQRKIAALYANMAQLSDEFARTLRDAGPLAEHVATESGMKAPQLMADEAEAAAYRMRTTQLIVAEQARNYDALMAAGGIDNPEAFAAWKESCELATALLPDPDATDLGT